MMMYIAFQISTLIYIYILILILDLNPVHCIHRHRHRHLHLHLHLHCLMQTCMLQTSWLPQYALHLIFVGDFEKECVEL
jgi:hypothetical protein